jgi:hypothetical protein
MTENKFLAAIEETNATTRPFGDHEPRAKGARDHNRPPE